MKPNIIFVDDFLSVLECLQLLFKDEPYYIFTLDNPLEALNIIKTLKWAVIVAERYMKHMDGLDFLKKFRELSPNTMWIFMTGDNETRANLEVLYSGNDYRFVKKPLDCIEIRQAVKEAIAQYENKFRKGA